MVAVMEAMEKSARKEKTSLTKRLLYEEIEREITASPNLFFSRFDRLTVADMSKLRRNLEKVSRRTMVVKHTLAKKILEKVKVPDAMRFLEGSVFLTLGVKEPQAASKILVEFVKSHESVQLKGLVLEGKVYDGNFIQELARLPSRNELLTLLAVQMQSPITRFARTLNAVLQSFVSVLDEVRKKKAAAETA